MAEDTLKVLIVDDMALYRRIMTQVFEQIPGTEVAGVAPNGRFALSKLDSLHVDLVLLDVEMPEMDGLATLDALREKHPHIGAIMVSAANRASAEVTMKALEKGAIDFVTKPSGSSPEDSLRQLVEKLQPLVRHFAARVRVKPVRPEPKPAPAPAHRTAAPAAPAAMPSSSAVMPAHFDVLAIGVSTGGPNALGVLIPALPADLGVPVVIVQHMPPVFTASLAENLNNKSKLHVCEARDGDPVEPNRVYIAPGGRHMIVRRAAEAGGAAMRVALNDNPPENSCRPSVDVLFRAVSAQYGNAVLAVILTGMGADGCEGVRVMKRRGCYCITQSEDTCVVYGMPRAVDEAGLSDARVPLPLMAERITQLIRKRAHAV